MVWRLEDPQGNESKKIVWEVAPYLRGRGLDIGAGDFKVLPHAISVDDMNHEQFGFSIKPDIKADASHLDVFASCSMDFVYSSHTLEHVEDMEATLKEWWRLVKQGGYLVLYLPHADFYPNMGQPGANPTHKRDFRPRDVIAAMPTGWDLLECQERNNDQEYSFLLVFKKCNCKRNQESWKKPRPEKTACVVRYGAFGDVLQASSIFKGLKALGYHVTVFASPPGSDVIQYDPNIDRLVLFDKDQVPNGNLTDFWSWQAKKYDKWVNLSESVEGALLAIPGRANYLWPPTLRHAHLNHNYLEFQHRLAGIPYKPGVKFYATAEEKTWAARERAKMGAGPVIVWSLAGSAVHKTWGGLDRIVAAIMLTYPTAHVVFVGGPEAVILEAGWENEPRVHRTSGKWSIRQSMAFLAEADLVIGPETGVLNAASHMDVPKIVFLSHSTHENLTRDWERTIVLRSANTKCKGRGDNEAPACHQLHYGWDNCTRHDDGVAQCMADIPPEDVWQAVQMSLMRVAVEPAHDPAPA